MTGHVIYSSDHQFRHFPESRYMADVLGITSHYPLRSYTAVLWVDRLPSALGSFVVRVPQGREAALARCDRVALASSLSQRACP